MAGFDRYSSVRINGQLEQLPFIEIPENPSDKYIEFIEGSKKTRFDVLSEKYYANPTLGFFILMANPEYLSEHDIPDGKVIRIPFPKDRIIQLYNDNLRSILER
jgi:hypothetical protein